jgi:hypothetical protein
MLVKDDSVSSLGSNLSESLEGEHISKESFKFNAGCIKYHDGITSQRNYVKNLSFGDKSNAEGNKEKDSNLLDSIGPSDRSTYAVSTETESSHIYKLSLSVAATAEEQTVFDTYRKKIETSGWSLTPMQALASEKVAYVAIPKGSNDELYLATRLTERILKQAFKETYGARR